VHNAEYLEHYPKLPAWISRYVVYAAWLAATLIGLAGYRLLRLGYRGAGLILLSAYGLYGLGSLAHYALAPASAHTVGMNLSIGLEASAAGFLLISILVAGVTSSRTREEA
jgi:hypothetical protein